MPFTQTATTAWRLGVKGSHAQICIRVTYHAQCQKVIPVSAPGSGLTAHRWSFEWLWLHPNVANSLGLCGDLTICRRSHLALFCLLKGIGFPRPRSRIPNLTRCWFVWGFDRIYDYTKSLCFTETLCQGYVSNRSYVLLHAVQVTIAAGSLLAVAVMTRFCLIAS